MERYEMRAFKNIRVLTSSLISMWYCRMLLCHIRAVKKCSSKGGNSSFGFRYIELFFRISSENDRMWCSETSSQFWRSPIQKLFPLMNSDDGIPLRPNTWKTYFHDRHNRWWYPKTTVGVVRARFQCFAFDTEPIVSGSLCSKKRIVAFTRSEWRNYFLV